LELKGVAEAQSIEVISFASQKFISEGHGLELNIISSLLPSLFSDYFCFFRFGVWFEALII
jgi:hypothetical protein